MKGFFVYILAGCRRGRTVRAVNPMMNNPTWVRIPPCQQNYGRYPSGFRDQSDKLGIYATWVQIPPYRQKNAKVGQWLTPPHL